MRRAADGERITTLDGKERTLTSRMLVIADAAEGRSSSPASWAARIPGVDESTTVDRPRVRDLPAGLGPLDLAARWASPPTPPTATSAGSTPTRPLEAAWRAIDLILATAGGEVVGPGLRRRAATSRGGGRSSCPPASSPSAWASTSRPPEMRAALESLELNVTREDAGRRAAAPSGRSRSRAGATTSTGRSTSSRRSCASTGPSGSRPPRVASIGPAGRGRPGRRLQPAGHRLPRRPRLPRVREPDAAARARRSRPGFRRPPPRSSRSPIPSSRTSRTCGRRSSWASSTRSSSTSRAASPRPASARSGRIFVENNGQNFEARRGGLHHRRGSRAALEAPRARGFLHGEAPPGGARRRGRDRPARPSRSSPSPGPGYGWQEGHSVNAGCDRPRAGSPASASSTSRCCAPGGSRARCWRASSPSCRRTWPASARPAAVPRISASFPPALRDIALVVDAGRPGGRRARGRWPGSPRPRPAAPSPSRASRCSTSTRARACPRARRASPSRSSSGRRRGP